MEQIEAFLKASASIRFEDETAKQVNPWIEQVLCEQRYDQRARSARGLVRRYPEKMTGRSRAQVTRLIARYREIGAGMPNFCGTAGR